jgi:hypothetical protein
MRKDLARAVDLVRKGYSFGEAAKRVGGITRCAVAGACHRAKVKSHTPPADGTKTARIAALYLEGVPMPEIRRQCGLSESSHIGSYLADAGVKPNRQKSRHEQT